MCIVICAQTFTSLYLYKLRLSLEISVTACVTNISMPAVASSVIRSDVRSFSGVGTKLSVYGYDLTGR